MRLEHCIRRWLGLKSHYVAAIEETPDAIVAELEAVSNHLPRLRNKGSSPEVVPVRK